MASQKHQCDCGATHSRQTFLNANTGNWLCRQCVSEIDRAEMALKRAKEIRLQNELERWRAER